MSSVSFSSRAEAEVIDVEFLRLDGVARQLRLLVDSGFTGRSSVLLPNAASDMVRAAHSATHTTGALQGLRERGWVTCRIADLQYEATVIAIITDTTSLSLPAGVDGLAGLTFLRQFSSWGSQRTANGWQFFLSVDHDPRADDRRP